MTATRSGVSTGARLAALCLAGVVLVACSGDETVDRGPAGTVTEPGTVNVFELQPGDCLDPDPAEIGEITDIAIVPCELSHGQEVLGPVEHPDVPYPGASSIAEWADGACLTELDRVLGLTLDDGVSISYLLPTFAGWNQEDADRVVICVLVATDPAGMTGSFLAGTATPEPATGTPDDDQTPGGR